MYEHIIINVEVPYSVNISFSFQQNMLILKYSYFFNVFVKNVYKW